MFRYYYLYNYKELNISLNMKNYYFFIYYSKM